VLFSALVLCASFSVGNERPHKDRPSRAWSVLWRPKRLINGSPVIFRVSVPHRLSALSGRWLGHTLVFRFDPDTHTWEAFAGISLATPAGTYALSLQGTTFTGETVSFERTFQTARGKYRNLIVRVPKRFTEPNKEQLELIAQDKAIKDAFFSKVTPEQEWSGPFQLPVRARISDVFGTTRTFNGKVQSVHQGLDFAVGSGTPVAALNSGTVLLARPLYFEGNCVVIDHGQGLLSLYLHFSEIKVKEGDPVTRGQILGLSGGSGRATGPHLHIAVRWQGVYLDPAAVLALRFLENDRKNSKPGDSIAYEINDVIKSY
jgi:hypothetical protein